MMTMQNILVQCDDDMDTFTSSTNSI